MHQCLAWACICMWSTTTPTNTDDTNGGIWIDAVAFHGCVCSNSRTKERGSNFVGKAVWDLEYKVIMSTPNICIATICPFIGFRPTAIVCSYHTILANVFFMMLTSIALKTWHALGPNTSSITDLYVLDIVAHFGDYASNLNRGQIPYTQCLTRTYLMSYDGWIIGFPPSRIESE